ncbi:hypothetical protein FGO68_gene9332 [Halteria grandinella]|uniref:Uncharacterized protein n=1 Tax=Halteria grandinella TaxID=5974 RepID=A0A8J8SZ25_HALGN|nr:hypothetical protein FGO68_gene9332 [Halteria grandinella]
MKSFIALLACFGYAHAQMESLALFNPYHTQQGLSFNTQIPQFKYDCLGCLSAGFHYCDYGWGNDHKCKEEPLFWCSKEYNWVPNQEGFERCIQSYEEGDRVVIGRNGTIGESSEEMEVDESILRVSMKSGDRFKTVIVNEMEQAIRVTVPERVTAYLRHGEMDFNRISGEPLTVGQNRTLTLFFSPQYKGDFNLTIDLTWNQIPVSLISP